MAEVHVDRNLLFGVLALQMDFISRENLIAAMHAWVLEKHKLLGDILVDQGALAASRRSLISAVVEEHVALHHGDPHQSLVALGVPAALHSDLEKFSGDPQLHASLIHLAGPAPAEHDAETTLVVGRGESAADGRFEILRSHAAGGLGEVHVALDRELNREVALKRIHNRHASRSDSRSRFLLEAEITGGLEHPGVVPVYALGTSADGRPYYAMRFIQGETLKEAVEKFHADQTAPEQQRRIDLRQLLNRFIAVCNAIEYAHSRGVIHRDIKPSNIMLGRYGETLVVDWGLAKALGRRSADAPPLEQTLIPSGSGSSETLAGSAIGTPAYMGPEQAAGRIDEIGPASDVYSLGATLYMLLTGKEPFEGPDLGGVLEKVQKGDFVPPRERNRAVPAPLDAICRKAMKLAPQDRYPSCAALASDVEHWLADEPVSAFAEPASVRASRWIRRHRGLTAGGAVLMAALFIGLIAGTAILGRANSRIADHAKEADRQRDVAEGERADATRQREIAEKERFESARQRDEATRQLYVSQMNLAQRAWDDNNVGRTRELLESQTPEHTGGVDLRGWEWHYLWRLTHSELRILKFMSLCLVFTPDGKALVSGGEDGTLKMWDADGMNEVWKVQGHKERIDRLAISGDGKVLATASIDRTLKLWDAATGQETRSFAFDHPKYGGLALSRDGTRLAAGAADGITVWSTVDGMQIRKIEAPVRFNSLAFHPDGNQLASGDFEFTVRFWDLATGREAHKFIGHRNRVSAVAISPDGRTLVSGDKNGAIKAWDLHDGTESVKFKGHADGVNQLVFSPDGSRLVSASDDTTVKIWSVTGDELRTFRGHASQVAGVAFSPSGQVVASGAWDETIRLWDLASTQEPMSLQRPREIYIVSFSPDHRWLAGAGNGFIGAFDASTFLPRWSDSVPEFVRRGNVRFDPTGKTVALGGIDGSIGIRDAQDGRPVRTFKALDNQEVTSLDFTHDGEIVAAGGYRQVALWKASGGHQLATLSGHSDWVMTVAFSPDGTRLASASTETDRDIRIWDVATGRGVRSLVGHEGAVHGLVFSSDGRHLFSGSNDEMIRTWDVETGATVRIHRGHSGTVFGLTLSPDGRRLASCSIDQSVKIWDVATGQELQTLKSNAGLLTSVAFSPDGTRLAAGSLKRSLTVWDARPLTDALRAEIAAVNVVEMFFGRHLLQKNAIEAINSDATLPESLRKQALELAEKRHVSPLDLNDRSWSLAAQPGRTIDQYELAIRCAEAACELVPDNGPFLNTLGVARYRAGKFAEAIETLTRSNELNSKVLEASVPADIAFLAMAHHQLGHADEARTFLEQLRQLLETDRWKTDAESKAFLQEATPLIPAAAQPPVETPPKMPS